MEMRPELDRAINLCRLKGTLAIEMNHAERQGVRDGDVDQARLQEALDQLARRGRSRQGRFSSSFGRSEEGGLAGLATTSPRNDQIGFSLRPHLGCPIGH